MFQKTLFTHASHICHLLSYHFIASATLWYLLRTIIRFVLLPPSFHGMTSLKQSDFLDGPLKHSPNYFHPNNFNYFISRFLKSLYTDLKIKALTGFLISSFTLKSI